MSELYKRIEVLCKENGITITEMCRRAEVPRANLTELKMERQQTIGLNSLTKIANLFGVSPAYFTEEAKEAPGAEPRAIRDEDIKFAMFGTTEITDEMLAELRRYADYLKERKL